MVENWLEDFLGENDKRSITLINPYSYCETMSRLSPHVASRMLDFSSLFSSQFVLCIVSLSIRRPFDLAAFGCKNLKMVQRFDPRIPIEMSIAWCWLFAPAFQGETSFTRQSSCPPCRCVHRERRSQVTRCGMWNTYYIKHQWFRGDRLTQGIWKACNLIGKVLF